ncbi:MAG: UDP-N-acetylmuramoyl-L-alanyl-D-glutamate--2,6-diaminopimelate ligase [Angelakisella sp.]
MKLAEYLTGIQYTMNDQKLLDTQITGITSDSRQVKKGCIFVCIKGGKFDGHTAAPQAVAEGAAVVVTETDLGLACQVLVENTRSAYAILCANHFDNPSRKLRLMGVTGTNGKTTITYLLKSILSAAGKKTGLMGTIHNEILDMVLPAKYTTPDPYQLHAMLSRMVEAGCEYVVMEASSHALDQHRLDGCEFDVAIFTNLTQDHLDYHETMENYYLAKRKLFDHCRKAVVNIDDSYGARLAEEIGKTAVTCSLSNDMAAFTAKSIECSAAGSKFVLVADHLIERVKVPMPGMFSVMNAMEAAVAAILADVSVSDAANGLSTCYGVTGRAEVIPTGRDFTIIRDYAHTPDGLEKIIGALRQFTTGRLVTLFGCAGNRDRTKRHLMADCVAAGSDLVILTSDNPRDEDPLQIINDAKPGLDRHKTPYKIIPDRYTAILWAIDNMQPGDLLLLAGKGHEDYQVLHDETIYFDERVLVEQILADDKA